jgi:HPr kinase/phosphorylase
MKIDEKNITRKEKISVRYFFEHASKIFDIKSFTGEIGFDKRFITQPNLHRPGLALAGFFKLFSYNRVQTFGNTEISYLKGIAPEKRREVFIRLFNYNLPCIVITNGVEPFPELLELALEKEVPIFGTDLDTTKSSFLIVDFLDDIFASQLSIHASFVDVYGVGMLFVGKSGIGKSEVALDLVERGHRLVADDVVILTKKGEGILMGAGTKLTNHFMEIRGIGIIDVRSMFGVRAVRYQKRLEVIIELEIWNPDSEYTRTGLDDASLPIMGVDIPYVRLPIVPGKNITVVAEVIALNYLLKHYGYDAAKVLTEKIQKRMEKKGEFDNTSVNYFEHDFE